MPNLTNLGLKKPLQNENYNIDVQNDNMDIITAQFEYSLINVKNYGLLGDGSANDAIDLNNLISNIGTDKKSIFFPESIYLIGTNINIPANIKLIFSPGAILKISNGVTITIENTKLEAGLYQIFDISEGGNIIGSFDIEYFYTQWFGAVPDFNVTSETGTDNTIAIQNSINYCINNDITLRLTEGVYGFSKLNASIPLNKTFKMDNTLNSILYKNVINEDVTFHIFSPLQDPNFAKGVSIKNLYLRGRGQRGTGLKIERVINYNITNLKINFFRDGLYLTESFTARYDTINLKQNHVGLRCGVSSNALVFNNLDATQNLEVCTVIEGGSTITFLNPILQGTPAGCVMTGDFATDSIVFVNPYFEFNSKTLIAIGYNEDLTQNSVAKEVNGVSILGSLHFQGTTPSQRFFKLRKIKTFNIENNAVDAGANLFTIEDGVFDVNMKSNNGLSSNMLSNQNAIKNKYNYRRNRNLISNGEFLGSQYSFSSGLTYTKNVATGLIDFNVPSDNQTYDIIFTLENPNQYESLVANVSCIHNSNLITEGIGFYDQNGSPINFSAITTAGEGVSTLRTIPTNTKITLRVLLKNNSGNQQTFSLRSVFLTEANDDNISPSTYDIMLQNSGTISVSNLNLTKRINREFDTRKSKILTSQDFEGTVKVTKGTESDHKSFDITVKFTGTDTNGNVDYLIIPYNQY